MLTGLIKFSAVTACGLVGGALLGAFSSEKKATSTTTSSGEGESSVNTQPFWTEKIEPTSSVLKCQQHERNYEVYLVTGTNKSEAETIEIGLEVRDVKQSNKVTWGLNAKEGEKWNEWELRVNNSGEIYMQVPSDNKEFRHNGYISIKCQESKFVSTLETGIGGEQNIKASLIKFTTSPTNRAQETSTKKEYSIQITIAEGSHVKWQQDFSPKVILDRKG